MAWQNIPNNSNWQFDNNPPDPGDAQTALWQKQTGGVRTSGNNHQVYTRVRRVGDGDISRGELSKSYWDAR
jgi:hypothetical protein